MGSTPGQAAVDKSQTAAPRQDPSAAAPDAVGDSRTRQATRGVVGHTAQAAQLSPKGPLPASPNTAAAAKAEDVLKQSADAPAATQAPAAGTAPDAAPLSAVREALLEQFRIMDGKGVGDEEFEKICGKDWWIKRKQDEADAKVYNKDVYPGVLAEWEAHAAKDPEWAKKNKRPPRHDDSPFTTCIATQVKLLEAVFRLTGNHVKLDPDTKSKAEIFGYGTMGRLEAKKRGAWVPASPGVTARPKPGDILMLEMRGEPDKVQKDIDAENSPYAMSAMNEKQLNKQLEQMRSASKGASEGMAQAAAAKIPAIEGKLAALKAKHDAKIAELEAKLDEARKKTTEKAGTEVEVKGGRRGGLEFSHVGFFVSSAPHLDEAGKPTGKELWSTFDGGQNVAGKVDNQGAKGAMRLYDPAKNEISSASKGPGGVMTQDGKVRWLAGWTNVDALASTTSSGRAS